MPRLTGRSAATFSDRVGEVLRSSGMAYESRVVQSSIRIPSLEDALTISEFFFESPQESWGSQREELREWYGQQVQNDTIVLRAFHEVFHIRKKSL